MARKMVRRALEPMKQNNLRLPEKLVREFFDDRNFPGEMPMPGQARMRRALWEDMERRKRGRRSAA